MSSDMRRLAPCDTLRSRAVTSANGLTATFFKLSSESAHDQTKAKRTNVEIKGGWCC